MLVVSQMPPISSLGTEHYVMQQPNRLDNYVKVVGVMDDTTVTLLSLTQRLHIDEVTRVRNNCAALSMRTHKKGKGLVERGARGFTINCFCLHVILPS